MKKNLLVKVTLEFTKEDIEQMFREDFPRGISYNSDNLDYIDDVIHTAAQKRGWLK